MPRDFDRPPRRNRPRRKPVTNSGGLVSLIVLGTVVLVGLGITVVYLSRRPASDNTAIPAPLLGGGNVVGPPAVVAPLVPPRPPLPEGWYDYQHPEGIYSVYLPQGPVATDPHQSGSIRQAIPIGQVLIDERSFGDASRQLSGSIRVVAVRPEGVTDMRTALEKSADRDSKGSRTPVVWCGQSTAEWSGRESIGVEYFRRILWVGNRVHIVTLAHRQDVPPTPEQRAAFFDSFVPRN